MKIENRIKVKEENEDINTWSLFFFDVCYLIVIFLFFFQRSTRARFLHDLLLVTRYRIGCVAAASVASASATETCAKGLFVVCVVCVRISNWTSLLAVPSAPLPSLYNIVRRVSACSQADAASYTACMVSPQRVGMHQRYTSNMCREHRPNAPTTTTAAVAATIVNAQTTLYTVDQFSFTVFVSSFFFIYFFPVLLPPSMRFGPKSFVCVPKPAAL